MPSTIAEAIQHRKVSTLYGGHPAGIGKLRSQNQCCALYHDLAPIGPTDSDLVAPTAALYSLSKEKQELPDSLHPGTGKARANHNRSCGSSSLSVSSAVFVGEWGQRKLPRRFSWVSHQNLCFQLFQD